MKIYTLLYEFEHINECGSEICGTAFTDKDKMNSYFDAQIEAVKTHFLQEVCYLEKNDDMSHIEEINGINRWSISNKHTEEFASLTIEEVELEN